MVAACKLNLYFSLIVIGALLFNQGCLEAKPNANASFKAKATSSSETSQDNNPVSNQPKIPATINEEKTQDKASAAKVIEVIDGDTIEVSINGAAYKVRYIGIDTPETKHPRKGLEYFGPEASAYNKKLVEGKTVRLVKDVSEIDKYGRLLRYVFIGDLFVNAKLVKEGYANASAYPPDVKYDNKFRELERYARDNNKGLWAPKKEATKREPTSSSGDNCEVGYIPCVPKYPPDINCGDIGHQVAVTGSDPHGLDRDGDGAGCESY